VNDEIKKLKRELLVSCILRMFVMIIGSMVFCTVLYIIRIPNTNLIFGVMVMLTFLDVPLRHYNKWLNIKHTLGLDE